MCRENHTWRAPRIHGELLELGIDIGESSVTCDDSAFAQSILANRTRAVFLQAG
jgi:hypothetical protein